MSEGAKSALVVNQSSKKQLSATKQLQPTVEYKQINNKNDFIGELSDEQKEAQFSKQHEEYIKMKLDRKKELIRIKKEQFGTSSSDENQQSSNQQIDQIKPAKKAESKKSRGKIEGKFINQNQPRYNVTLELKKLYVDTQLLFLDKEFEINKRTIPYSKIIRIHLLRNENQKSSRLKLKIILNDEQFNLADSDKEELGEKDKTIQMFLAFFKVKLQSKEIKFYPPERKSNPQQFSNEQKSGALAYDKIFKKSQIIGTWEQRYIIIKKDGLYSYRSLKSKPTMFIALKEMKQLQTQFEMYKDLIVVKLIYNTAKTEFGLPIDSQLEWVNKFANLITKQLE